MSDNRDPQTEAYKLANPEYAKAAEGMDSRDPQRIAAKMQYMRAKRPLQGKGSLSDEEQFKRYKKEYDDTAIPSNDLRVKLVESGITDSYAQDEFVSSIVNKAENLARSKKLSVVDDDTFDQVIKENGLDGFDSDIVDALKTRSQNRYNNAVGMYKMRLKTGVLQKPSDPKPQPEESFISGAVNSVKNFFSPAETTPSKTPTVNANLPKQQKPKLSEQLKAQAAEPKLSNEKGTKQPVQPKQQFNTVDNAKQQTEANVPIGIAKQPEQPSAAQIPGADPTARSVAKKPLIDINNYNQDQRKADALGLPVETYRAGKSPAANTVDIEYAMHDGKVIKEKFTPIGNDPAAIKQQKQEYIGKQRFQYKYGSKTQIPVSVERTSIDKNSSQVKPTHLVIGDLAQAEKDLQLEFIDKFSQAAVEMGGSEFSASWAKSIANQLVPMLTDKEEGTLDFLSTIAERSGKWRIGLFQMFGVDDEFESIVGKDENLRSIYEDYKRKFSDLQQLTGSKAFYGSRIPLDKFAASNNPLDNKNVIDGLGSIAQGALGWTSKYVKQGIERMQEESTERMNYLKKNAGKGQVSGNVNEEGGAGYEWDKIFTADINDFATVEELREIVLRNGLMDADTKMEGQSDVNKIMTGLGYLFGSLRGTGGLGLASKVVAKAPGVIKLGTAAMSKVDSFKKAASILKDAKVYQAVANNKTIQNTARILSTSPEFGDGIQTAATFFVSNLIESMPTATDETIKKSIAMGFGFGVIGTGLSQRLVFPMMARSNMYQKVLENPDLRTLVDNVAGTGASALLYARAAERKQAAYLLGNALANPLQDVAVASIEGNPYGLAELVVSTLAGAPLGYRFAKDRGRFSKDKPLTPDDFIAFAAADKLSQDKQDAERYAENRTTEAKDDIKAGANPIPDNISDVPNEPTTPDVETAREMAEEQEAPVSSTEQDAAAIEAELYEELATRQDPKYTTPKTDQAQETPATRDQPVETTFGQRRSEIVDFDNKLSELQKEVFGLIEPMLADKKIVYHNGETSFDTENKIIYVDKKLRNSDNEINALMHEGLHSATFDLIESNPEFRSEVLKLQKQVLNSRFFQKWSIDNSAEAAYVASDPHEFFVAFVDNKHGIADLITAKAKSTGSRLMDMTSRVFGNSEIDAVTALGKFRELSKQIKPAEVLPTAEQQAVVNEDGLRDSINNVDQSSASDPIPLTIEGVVDAFVQGRSAEMSTPEFLQFYENNSKEIEDAILLRVEQNEAPAKEVTQAEVDDIVTGQRSLFPEGTVPQAGTRKGLFKDWETTLKLRQIKNVQQKEESIRLTSDIIAEFDRMGIRDEVGLGYAMQMLNEKNPHWENISPEAKIKEIHNIVRNRQGGITDAELAELRELSDKTGDYDELRSYEWLSSPTLDKRVLAQLLGKERVSELEADLNRGMQNPVQLLADFPSKIAERLNQMGADEDKIAQAQSKARDFVHGYIKSHHNTQEVTPLGVGEDLEGKKGIRDLSALQRDPSSQKVLQRSVQNPTAMLTRLNNVKNEMLQIDGKPNAEGTNIYPHFNASHVRVANALSLPRIGTVTNSDLLERSELFKDAATTGRNLLDSGWFMLPKGNQGNIFFDLSELIKPINYSTTPAEARQQASKLIRTIDDLTLTHYATSENRWGIGKNKDVSPALAAFDLWKLAEMARNNETFSTSPDARFEDVMQPALRDAITAQPKWVEAARKQAPRLANAGNELIKRIAQYHAENSSSQRPEIFHEVALEGSKEEAVAAVAASIYNYYHKIFDHANLNDEVVDKKGKAPKNMGKYMGVQTQFAYNKMKDAKTVDALIRSKNPNHLPIDIQGMDMETAQASIDYWGTLGLIIDNKGGIKLKQFVMTDAWAEANPQIWASLTGQKLTSISTGAKPEILIPQNLVSGVTQYGTTQFANENVRKELGKQPTSIDMIERGLRTRTTRSASEMQRYGNLKPGDIITHTGNGKKIKSVVTAVYGQDDPRFVGNWDKEGWTKEGVAYISRFKQGAKAIEFELLKSKPAGVKLVGDTQYVVKDQAKADKANKFIGRGSDASSTAKYAASFGELANTGNYTPSDVVFISAEGNRSGRVAPDFNEISRAIDAGATFITDVKADRERPYNLGEREVAEYLGNRKYKEVQPGVWEKQLDQPTPKKLVPPSKWHDGASYMINKGTHDALAELNNEDPDKIGAIKYGYGGDWIYKSDFTPVYSTGRAEVDGWFESLKGEGFSSVVVQSGIKSKARTYKRSAQEPGIMAVHDDDGTLMGFENNGEFKPVTAEEINVRYTDKLVHPELVRTYDLIGDNAIGLANMAKSNDDFSRGVTFGLDRTPYTAFGENDSANVLENAHKRIREHNIYKFAQMYDGYKTILEGGPVTNSKPIKNLVEGMIRQIEQMDESDVVFGDVDMKTQVLRHLQNTMLGDDRVNINKLRALDIIFPNLLRGSAELKPIAKRVLANYSEAAEKTLVSGKSYRLAPYIPKANHQSNIWEISRKWKRQEILESLEKSKLNNDEKEYLVEERLKAWEQDAQRHIDEHYDEDGVLPDMGQGYIMSMQDIEIKNLQAQKDRARGINTPYIMLGSKTISKLNPADALTSWAPRVLVGADSDLNTGAMANQPFVINSIGRDHDGDMITVLYDHPDWSSEDLDPDIISNSEYLRKTEGNQFLKLHEELTKLGAHTVDEYKAVSDADPTQMRDAMGRPFTKRAMDMRVNMLDGIRKTLDANSATGEDIGDGISILNNYYESVRQDKYNRITFDSTKETDKIKFFGSDSIEGAIYRDASPGFYAQFTIEHLADVNNLKTNDAYFKQAQYDRYGYTPYDPREVFTKTRFGKIFAVTNEAAKATYAETLASIERYNKQGIVDKNIWDLVKKYTQPIKGDQETFVGKMYGSSSLASTSARVNSVIDIRTTSDAAQSHISAVQNIINEYRSILGKSYNYDTDALKVSKESSNYNGANATLANFDPFRKVIPDPNAWVDFSGESPKVDPVQAIHIKEMLGRMWTKERTIIDITPNVAWELASDGIFLRTPDETIPVAETINHQGLFHNAINELIATDGIALSEIFPRDIIGHVSLADVKNKMDNLKLKQYLQANPDVTLIRCTGIKDVTQDISFKGTEENNYQDNLIDLNVKQQFVPLPDVPNFVLIPIDKRTSKDVVPEIASIIKDQIAKGNRVVIDRESLGSKEGTKITLPTSILDLGRKVKLDRAYNDAQRRRIQGKFFGAINPETGILSALNSAYVDFGDNVYLQDQVTNPIVVDRSFYDYYRGVKDIGANVKLPNGIDIIDNIIYEQSLIFDRPQVDGVDVPDDYAVAPASQKPGRKLGLFNGKLPKISGTALNNGKAGPLNRLNKYLGKDLLSLDFAEVQNITEGVEQYLRDEFPKMRDKEAFMDAMLHAFDPTVLRTMETGEWDKIRRSKGEQYYKAAKAFYFTQAISEGAKIYKNQLRGASKTRTLATMYGVLSAQSTSDMVRYFANDQKVYSAETPIFESANVSLTPAGTSVRVAQAKLGQEYDPMTKLPKFASLESGSAVRHSWRHKQLNGIKDRQLGFLNNWRDQYNKLFPEGVLFTRDGAQEAMAMLRGDNNPFAKDVQVPFVETRPDGSTLAGMTYAKQPAQLIPEPEFFVDLKDDAVPTLTAKFILPDGSERLMTATPEENGFFDQADMTEMINLLMPDETYFTTGKASRAEIASIVKQAIAAKTYNATIAAYQHSYAGVLREYINRLREYNNDAYNPDGSVREITDSAFYDVINQAEGMIKELTEEANARYYSTLADNVDAMSYVNYDTMASDLTKWFDAYEKGNWDDLIGVAGDNLNTNQSDKLVRESVLMKLGGLAESMGVMKMYNLPEDIGAVDAGRFVVSHLRRRLAHANAKNKQLTKTNAFFEMEVLNPEDRTPVELYSLVDSKIMKALFGDQVDYNPDMIYRKNQEAINNVINKTNAIFRNAYVKEKNVRKTLGMDYLNSGIAENNLLVEFSNDNAIYTQTVDVHSSNGLRQSLVNATNNGKMHLNPDEIGMPIHTPMSITFIGDDQNSMRTINGNLAGVVRLPNTLVVSKAIKDLQKEIGKFGQSTATDERLLESLAGANEYKNTLDQDNGYKDCIVVYNSESGALNYIDLATVTTALTGEVNGTIDRAIMSRKSKYIAQKFGGVDKLGEWLASNAAVSTMKTLTPDQTLRTTETLSMGRNNNIKFFGTIGRDAVPPGVAKLYKGAANVMNSASQLMHGYGKEALTVATALSIAPIELAAGLPPAIATALLIRTGWKTGFKFVKNATGNRFGYASRAFQTLSAIKARETIANIFGAKNQIKKGTATAASLSARLTQGVGMDAQVYTSDQAARKESGWTLPLQRQQAELDKIKKHYDGLAEVLTDDDLVDIQEYIRKSVYLKENVIAEIRNGQLSLSLTNEQNQYLRNLSELWDMNLDPVNAVLIGSARFGKLSKAFAPVSYEDSKTAYARSLLNPFANLARLNNRRLDVWRWQGSQEVGATISAAASGEQNFDRLNVGQPKMDDQVARVNFVNAVVDVLQGKFDQRAYNLRTPMGRALSLFSQYSQNFNRLTTFQPVQEQKFWADVFSNFADDPEFRKALVSKYGVDVGNQIVQTPYTNFDQASAMPTKLPTVRTAQLAVHGLFTAAFTWLLQTALEQYGVNNQELLNQVEGINENLLGTAPPVSSLIKSGVIIGINKMSYEDLLWNTDMTKKSYQRKQESALTDLIRSIPGGPAYSGPKEALAIGAMYMMHTFGILPEFKPNWERSAKQVGGSFIAPIGIYSAIERDVEKSMPKKTKKKSLY